MDITNALCLYLSISSDLDFKKVNDAAMPNTFNPECQHNRDPVSDNYQTSIRSEL